MFIVDFYGYDYIHLIHEKSQLLCVQNYKAELEKQVYKMIKSVRASHGVKFYSRYDCSSKQCSRLFCEFLEECSIISQYSKSVHQL